MMFSASLSDSFVRARGKVRIFDVSAFPGNHSRHTDATNPKDCYRKEYAV